MCTATTLSWVLAAAPEPPSDIKAPDIATVEIERSDAVFAACECLPLIVDEWEGYHCPGFG